MDKSLFISLLWIMFSPVVAGAINRKRKRVAGGCLWMSTLCVGFSQWISFELNGQLVLVHFLVLSLTAQPRNDIYFSPRLSLDLMGSRASQRLLTRCKILRYQPRRRYIPLSPSWLPSFLSSEKDGYINIIHIFYSFIPQTKGHSLGG